jgi:hypothetical protein
MIVLLFSDGPVEALTTVCVFCGAEESEIGAHFAYGGMQAARPRAGANERKCPRSTEGTGSAPPFHERIEVLLLYPDT